MKVITRAALALVALPAALLGAAPAYASPLPDFCGAADVCTTRLTSVTADVVNGTITGTPVGGGPAITLSGQADAYLTSAGFGAAPPELMQEWDTAIERTGALSTDSSDPNWYGNAKAKVFLSRTLNDIATRFPADTLVVRFGPTDGESDWYRLVSIQPSAE